MSKTATMALVERYYAAFNTGDAEAMLACLHDRVEHDINEGARQSGKDAFQAFLTHMGRCYREQLSDIVILVSDDGARAAAEFVVHGEYLVTDQGLPPANGQRYDLPAGSFLEIRDGRISRVTMYYNLADWTRQVSA